MPTAAPAPPTAAANNPIDRRPPMPADEPADEPAAEVADEPPSGLLSKLLRLGEEQQETGQEQEQQGAANEPADIFEAGLRVLRTPDAFDKARLTLQYAEQYQQGSLPLPPTLPRPRAEVEAAVPDIPARPETGRVQGASSKGLRATIHGIAHAESWAIDLMWDLLLRFAYEPWPPEFYGDFVEIAKQEARHFSSWATRLEEGYGMRYGDLKGTETLWECAQATADDALARLSVINLVHEARGLDTSEGTMLRLERAGDAASAATLKHNAKEEEGHVAAGLKWFGWLAERRGLPGTGPEVFHSYVRARFKFAIRPPFNTAARARANMRPEWYEPLITPSVGAGNGEGADGGGFK